ncbi:LysR family transcriptional regulator [Arenibacterium sp. CAU 1754]
MHSQNWDNLRFVLCVADNGSVSAAARILGVNHATVLRRVAAFEQEHGGAVFEKTPSGYNVLPDRVQVINAAREVENAVFSVNRLMHGARAPLRGTVRVSSTDSLSQIVLPPLIARLHAASSELQVDVLSSNNHLDFSRLQADISVRPALGLPDEMAGDTSATLVFRAYAAPGAGQAWLSLTGALARSAPAKWIADNIPSGQMSGGADSFMVLREMALLGTGIAVLPAFLGDCAQGLDRVDGAIPEIEVPIWVATSLELRDVPRIRVVRDRILDYLAERADVLAGRV